eukprot:TRINITY_DN14844_c0_g1_i1.p1 TRINITY_DN14844_c0_g1~~TRINITY_DN14844_c0_g1_i1.p1  ORF type:complete len:326 (+),score=49.30 TRINITY_DN14844_c0_g1_i1:81-1058(+)
MAGYLAQLSDVLLGQGVNEHAQSQSGLWNKFGKDYFDVNSQVLPTVDGADAACQQVYSMIQLAATPKCLADGYDNLSETDGLLASNTSDAAMMHLLGMEPTLVDIHKHYEDKQDSVVTFPAHVSDSGSGTTASMELLDQVPPMPAPHCGLFAEFHGEASEAVYHTRVATRKAAFSPTSVQVQHALGPAVGAVDALTHRLSASPCVLTQTVPELDGTTTSYRVLHSGVVKRFAGKAQLPQTARYVSNGSLELPALGKELYLQSDNGTAEFVLVNQRSKRCLEPSEFRIVVVLPKAHKQDTDVQLMLWPDMTLVKRFTARTLRTRRA